MERTSGVLEGPFTGHLWAEPSVDKPSISNEACDE